MKNFDKYERQYFLPPVCEYDWAKKDYIEKAPIWCSVDLRDGNQALIEPMSLDEKLEFFQMLVDIGFKEIEVGFPAASETEFIFMRTLIERDMIPDDVTVQVLTQAREHIIKKTFEAVKGAPHAVIHLYNSTSVAQREQVFKKDKEHIMQLAVDGAKLLKRLASETEGDFSFEYSPESFHGTEVDYAVEVCNAVLDVWQPTKDKKVIINIPTTVENAMPHVFAGQVEYVDKNLKYRDGVVLSLHPHNDRGCGVATAEMGILAGADRIEGTLFGNGERTGNVDVAAIALNMYTQGVAPNLDFSNINEIIATVEECTGLPVHPRHPYAGDLVFTAFSGSHQDAIKKGFEFQKNEEIWDMPYLPIDPKDLGRDYDAVIRVNSQSGKGGIAYLLESNYNVVLPRRLQIEFSQVVQQVADEEGVEVSAQQIWSLFKDTYVETKNAHYSAKNYRLSDENGNQVIELDIELDGEIQHLRGEGNGPISAMLNALQLPIDVLNYEERSISSGAHAKALALIEIQVKGTGKSAFGAGVHDNIVTASIEAILACTNRLIAQGVLSTDQVIAAAV